MMTDTTKKFGHEVVAILGESRSVLGATGISLLLVMFWAEWPVLVDMAGRWRWDARYSHGFLVPILAGFLLWRGGRPEFRPTAWSAAAALALFLVGGVLKILGTMWFFGWFDAVSLLVWLAGVAVLVGGWPTLARVWPAIAFLVFMIPLPYRVEMTAGAPMQRMATETSTYLLQAVGLPATSEGNVIALDDERTIAVVEACNGLGMLWTFACYATAAALLIRRPPLDRWLLLVSAVPLALGANVLRITSTGLMHRFSGNHAADLLFHEVAGWLMMPVALLLFWGELRLLDLLFIDEQGTNPTRMVSRRSKRVRPGSTKNPTAQLQGDV